MRKLFIFSTGAFWLVVAGFWLANFFLSPESFPAVSPVVEPADRSYTLAEVAGHGKEDDCWMAIEGQVYDIAAYLPDHPSEPDLILPWCGKDATQAWQTKGKGRPHSSRANQLLAKYRIGKQELRGEESWIASKNGK